MLKWMDYANRINSGMQDEASDLAKFSLNNRIDNINHLNSYAFYGRNLATTLMRHMPQNYERTRVEELFADEECSIYVENSVRKRTIISCDFGSSLQVNHIFDCFHQLG